MNYGAQPLCVRLLTCCSELFFGEGRSATVTDAGGGKNLEDVGSIGLHFTNEFADLSYAEAAVIQRIDGGEDAWTGNVAAVDGVAQVFILRGTEALHCGEAGLQGLPCIGR